MPWLRAEVRSNLSLLVHPDQRLEAGCEEAVCYKQNIVDRSMGLESGYHGRYAS